MPNAKDLTSGGTNILLVGDSGTHKTHMLGGFPKPFIFDFDAGMAINRGRDVEYETFKDKPRDQNGIALEPNAMEKKAGFYKFGTGWYAMIKKINELGTMMDKDTCPYLTLGLDSITFMSELALNAALMEQDKKVIHQGTYGAQIAYLKTVLSQLTAWPIRVVATAHIHRDTNDLTQVTEKLPLVTGKLAGFIGAFFDEVYFTEPNAKEKGKFMLVTNATPDRRQAKSRWGVPDGTEATYEAIKKYLEPKVA